MGKAEVFLSLLKKLDFPEHSWSKEPLILSLLSTVEWEHWWGLLVLLNTNYHERHDSMQLIRKLKWNWLTEIRSFWGRDQIKSVTWILLNDWLQHLSVHGLSCWLAVTRFAADFLILCWCSPGFSHINQSGLGGKVITSSVSTYTACPVSTLITGSAVRSLKGRQACRKGNGCYFSCYDNSKLHIILCLYWLNIHSISDKGNVWFNWSFGRNTLKQAFLAGNSSLH